MKQKVDLLRESILPGLTKLAVPIMATSLVQMAYNLTDMAWIGRLGSGAVTAVGSAGMYTWFSQGFAILARTGGQVKAAHSLGAGEEKEASLYAGGAIWLGLIFALLYGMVSVFGADPLIGFFGLQDPGTIASAKQYLRIAGGLVVFSYLNSILTGLFTATGDSRTPFRANVAGLLFNVVLDPVLIFGIGPFPAMGAVGAAAATVLSQLAVSLIFWGKVRQETQLFADFSLFRRIPFGYIREIVRIGLPAAVQNLIYAGISMILTRLVAGWGDKAVAVQRVGSQIESVSWMVGDGFAAAINAFIGQNYGARQMERVKRGFYTAMAMTAVWGICTTSLLYFGAGPLFSIFIAEPDVLAGGVEYLRIIAFSQLLMLVEQTAIGAFSGLGKTLYPSVVSVTLTSARIPLAYLFSGAGLGLAGVWWALTVTSDAKGIFLFFSFLLFLPGLDKKKKKGNRKK